MKHYAIMIFICLLTIFTIVACTVGPDYKRPNATVPSHFKEAKNNKNIWRTAKPNDACERGDWWKIFHDKELSRLEEQLNKCNQSVAVAAANYMQAQALVEEARANYFPVLTSSASLIRQKGAGSTTIISTSNGGISTGGGSSTGITATSSSPIRTDHAIVFDASWQPDIWGLTRRTVEATEGGAQASAAQLALTRLSSQASLATYYFELRALDTDQRLLDDTVRADKKILTLTKNQYEAGVASRSAVLQAQSQFESTQALAINNRASRAVFEHAIAVLIGIPPADFSLPQRPLTSTPPIVPVGLPSSLLERRPDVAQAERLMMQANAQIGVAVAAYYPSLDLTANGTFSGHSFADAINLPQMGWAYGPQLTQLIFDGGLRQASIKAAEAGYRSTVASYRQTVLAAFQNVEDSLSTMRILAKQAIPQQQAAVTARKALALVVNEYKAGTVPYTTVLTAQNAAYSAEKAAADITGQRMTATVDLIIALGGGWDGNLHPCVY